MLIAGIGFSQDSFSDDFESYQVGDYVGKVSSQWTTWSGNTGGAEDARVSDVVAASGSNSIYFQGAVGGGPQDVVLPFGGKRTTGSFQYEMNMIVPEGNGAYFNFQGEVNIGTTWSMNARFGTDGSLRIDDGSNVRLSTNYPQNEWFNIAFDINLTSNLWRMSINGECVGSFDNPNNFIASIDLFPIDEENIFYVDDVSYSYDPQAEAISFDIDASINAALDGFFAIAGTEKALAGVITNQGTQNITSFKVGIESGILNTTQEYTGINVAPNESYVFNIDETYSVRNGTNNLRLVLLEVNGEENDANLCNNSQGIVLTGFKPTENKKIFVEEATGTWCTWCPRGDVYMNLMTERYPDRFVGIAVHNNDPMMLSGWNAGVTSTNGFTGFPGVIVNRETVVDPSAVEPAFVSRVQGAAFVYLTHGAAYNEATRELTVAVSTHFNFDLTGDLKLFVGLTEDGVTGTGSGYNQVNAYSGGNNGVMGGYELLPNPVPASQMVYNHVGRYMFTDYDGLSGAYNGENTDKGSIVTHIFTYTIPPEFNHENMHIVSAFTAPPGVVNNANSTTIEEAVANGLPTSNIDLELDSNIDVYPNPFNNIVNIELNFSTPQEVRMEVNDAVGSLIATRNYGTISGNQIFTFDGTALNSGIYYLKMYSGDKFTTKRVIVSH